MLNIRTITLSFILMAGNFLYGQNSLDIQRYSGYSAVGTAKSVGMGGAVSAIGADFGSVTLNPASIAIYRKSDIGFSMGFRSFSTKSTHIDQTQNSNTSNFGFPNFHAIFAAENNSGTIKGWAFGIGFNQLDNYYRRTEVSAFNPYNSIADYYVALAQGSSIYNIDTASLPFMAWQVFYVDTILNDYTWVPYVEGKMQQTYSRKETGRTNSWDFVLGLNFNDKLYIGGSLSLLDLKYTSSEVFLETDTQGNYDTLDLLNYRIDIRSFEQRYTFRTSGTGINGKIGFLFRPIEALRIGLAFQTTTGFNLKDTYQVGMTMTQDGGAQYPKEGAEGLYNYRLRTPLRATLGVCYQFGKVGMISADADYIDFTQGSLSDRSGAGTTFTGANQVVAKLAQSQALNLRLGGEYRINNDTYLRAGYARYASFWNSDGEKYDDLATYNQTTGSYKTQSFNSNRQLFSAGFGYKTEDYYFDFALMYQIDHLKYNLYEMPINAASLGWGISPVLTQTRNQLAFLITMGFKF